MVVISMLLLIFAFGGAIGTMYNDHVSFCPTFVWVGAFITIANALLLYATLRTQILNQKRQEELVIRERFETTFFNLLQSHRQIANEIQIYRPTVIENDISQTKNLSFLGRRFFSFALIDIKNINSNLKKEQIHHYNSDDAQAAEEYFSHFAANPENRFEIEEERKKLINRSREAMVNSFYGIKQEHVDESKQNSRMGIQLFDRKWKGCYEHYLRSLIHLLEYIKDSGQDIDKYVEIVFSQMSEDEFNFIIRLSLINDRLLDLIRDTRLYGKQLV